MTTIIIFCYIWFVGSKTFFRKETFLTDDLLEIESHLNIQRLLKIVGF